MPQAYSKGKNHSLSKPKGHRENGKQQIPMPQAYSKSKQYSMAQAY